MLLISFEESREFSLIISQVETSIDSVNIHNSDFQEFNNLQSKINS